MMNHLPITESQTLPDFQPNRGPDETCAEENRLTVTVDIHLEELIAPHNEVTLHQPDGYELIQELGRGSVAIVFEARELRLNRIVALKMLRAGSQASQDELSRFRQEAETVAKLTHPNIVGIHGVAEHRGVPFLSLELVEGGTLDRLINGRPQLPSVCARIVEGLARGIHLAHENGIIHRDLKPLNVLLTTDGVPKITDFGVAKFTELNRGHTQTGIVMGTPCYIAPEQARGEKELGPAVDIYALGAILYEMLTGRPPHNGPTPIETIRQVLNSDPISPSELVPGLNRDLEVICLRCLEKNPSRRYSTAWELANDLQRFQNHLPILARQISGFERAYRWMRRHPRESLWLLSTAVLMSLLVFFGLSMLEQSHERQLESKRHIQEHQMRFSQAIKDFQGHRSEYNRELDDLRDRQRCLDRAGFSLHTARSYLLSEIGIDQRGTLQRLERQYELDRRDQITLQELEIARLEVRFRELEFRVHPTRDLADLDYRIEPLVSLLSRHEINLETGSIDEMSRIYRNLPAAVRIRFADALDHLSSIIGPSNLQQRCTTLAREFDTDEERSHIRAAFNLRDHQALLRFAERAESGVLTQRTSLLVANALIALGEKLRGLRTLEAAARNYPRDFWLNYELAIQSLPDSIPDFERAIRYMAVARSLRAPDPTIELHLALVLHLAQRIGESTEIVRRLPPDWSDRYPITRDLQILPTASKPPYPSKRGLQFRLSLTDLPQE